MGKAYKNPPSSPPITIRKANGVTTALARIETKEKLPNTQTRIGRIIEVAATDMAAAESIGFKNLNIRRFLNGREKKANIESVNTITPKVAQTEHRKP